MGLLDFANCRTSPWDGVVCSINIRIISAKSPGKELHESYEIRRQSILLSQQLQDSGNCRLRPFATVLTVGIMEVCKEAYPDRINPLFITYLDTAVDPLHPYYDEKSAQKEEPVWYMVDVKFVRKLKRFIPLKELQEYKETELKDMTVVKTGRLSVQPVGEKEW